MLYWEYMLPKENRLKKKTDIERVFEHGKFTRGKGVQLVIWRKAFLLEPERGYTKDDIQYAIVVPKKIEKSAVRRNILKRRVREALRLLLKEYTLTPGQLGVVMVQKEAKTMTMEEIKKSLVGMFTQAQLFS